MNKTGHILFGFFLITCLCACQSGDKSNVSSIENSQSKDPVFELLGPDQTGVTFENTLTEGLNTNILVYEYFYNGGGVATADFDGNGMDDIYFVSNMGQNKVYLNQGSLQFMDITQLCGAEGRSGPWKTGVSTVDVNGDGLVDIYLCYSGALPDEKRKNQLFINQGNGPNGIPRFEDMANQYGLASSGYSNQGYFFDYDRDGDLDMLLLNHNPKSLPVLNEVSTEEFLKQDDPQRGVRLFNQENNRFTDVTIKSGVSGSGLTYGLGLGISDLNKDGWPDFYVSNDYAVPDYLYINNGDGTFSDRAKEFLGHTSHFSMGNDVADVNNDGYSDVVTLDMLPEDNYRQKLLMSPDNYSKFDHNLRLGFHYQYMRNMLHLNNQNNSFSEIGQLAGISNTDWSWAALLADYDSDGWKDLFVTNGYYRDYTNLDFINYMEGYVAEKGRLVREDVLEIINQMPASDVVNYIFRNEGMGQEFVDRTEDWGIGHKSNSNGAAYADLDNDGDLDLVTNNINQSAFIYRNNSSEAEEAHYLKVQLEGDGKNTQAIGAEVTIHQEGHSQSIENIPTRGYLSSVSTTLFFGLSGGTVIDSLNVRWPDGSFSQLTDVATDTTLEIRQAQIFDRKYAADRETLYRAVDPAIPFKHVGSEARDFDRQPLLIREYSHDGACMIKGDVNGDGLEDIFVGGGPDQQGAVFVQKTTGDFSKVVSPVFDMDKDYIDVKAAFLDADGDGSLDIVVGSGGYHNYQEDNPIFSDRLYLNDGTGHFVRSETFPEYSISTGSVAIGDLDGDGDTDIFIGGRVVPGRYPESPESLVLINDGTGNFSKDASNALGMIASAVIIDLNGDNRNEIILSGEWMPIRVFAWDGSKLEEKTSEYFERSLSGWWNAIAIDDLNGDGRLDIVAGNMGLNNQFAVSPAEPAELYFDDFDNNGSVDPIFCYYIEGKSWPYVTRDELFRQLPYLKSRYTSYASYGEATMVDLFGQEAINNADKLSVEKMSSTVLLQGQDGIFREASLPVEAQYAPVHAIALVDYDLDGDKDLLLCGNDRHVKLRLGKYDANYGMLFENSGNGSFTYIPQNISGFKIKGDVRSIVNIEDNLYFGISGGEILHYTLSRIRPEF